MNTDNNTFNPLAQDSVHTLKTRSDDKINSELEQNKIGPVRKVLGIIFSIFIFGVTFLALNFIIHLGLIIVLNENSYQDYENFYLIPRVLSLPGAIFFAIITYLMVIKKIRSPYRIIFKAIICLVIVLGILAGPILGSMD